MTKLAWAAVLIASLSIVTFAPAQNVVVGVNVVNPMRASITDQNAVLAQLHEAGVKVIRCGFTPDANGIDFAKRAAAQGIKIELGLSPKYLPNAPKRPYRPDIFPSMWSGSPLSFADPALSQASFQSMFDPMGRFGTPADIEGIAVFSK